MKIVSAKQMQHLEAQAYRDGASEIDFMEEAGSGIALVVHDYIEIHYLDHTIGIVCGKGNNAGDGYVAGIHLLHLEYDVVAYQLIPIDDCSHLCQVNYQRFLEEGGRVMQVDSEEELAFHGKAILIDAILGTGFTGEIQEPFASTIRQMNLSGLPIISVDIPSGLNGTNGKAQENLCSVIATETAFLGLPKTGFFLNDGWNSVGKLRYVDFGLSNVYIDESDEDMVMLTKPDVAQLFPKIERSRHKYQAGLVVGLAGSPGMPGAALMAGSSALHGGAGIVRCLHPKGMEVELSASIPELIKIAYDPADATAVIFQLNKASAAYLGPGMGKSEIMLHLLQQVLPKVTVPCVIDADALTLLSSPEGQKIPLPEKVILTPHRGEMNRLLGIDEHQGPITLEYLNACLAYASERRATIVLKGGPTFILQPDMPLIVCPKGDPGMATAGTGDLLTGLLAGLLAQKLTPFNAAKLGTYIHGIAGEFAAAELTSYCMTASDLLYRFPEGFLLEEL